MRRIAIVGGGIAGLTATYQLARLAREGVPVEATLYESSNRFGGIIETVREGGFTVETGPDAWVTAKPWASELAIELGLADELIPSNDATRKTWILLNSIDDPAGRLVAMPDGMNLMVPFDLDALDKDPKAASLFTAAAIAAYRAEPARAVELRSTIPAHDESVADFTLRHLGPEVLERVAAPLLSGIFGGDVRRLSVRAVMPAFVQMEREHGSIVAALQAARAQQRAEGSVPSPAIFTTLRSGLGSLVDRLVAAIPSAWLRLNTAITALEPPPGSHPHWSVCTATTGKQIATQSFDAVFLATPLDATRSLLAPFAGEAASLLPAESSSALLVAFCFPNADQVPVPPGFGFLVPPGINRKNSDQASSMRESATEGDLSAHFAFDPGAGNHSSSASLLLACTFTDQKFRQRVPPGGRLLRAFFGGAAADRLARCNNDEVAAITRLELARILNRHACRDAPLSGPTPTPLPAPILTVIRRLPASLPQYMVGHLDRVAQLDANLRTFPGLTLLGNALHGVGIPDLIRDARQAARREATRTK